MSKPNTYWLWNNTANDGPNSGNSSGGTGGSSSYWVVFDLSNDKLTFLDDQQNDGDSLSGAKYPVVIPDSGSIEAPKTFVEDQSAGVYDQVPLAGTQDGAQSGGDTRYVFAIYFDGPTATVPYLEAWDDSDHDSAVDPFLGGGTASDSTLRAIATTTGSPGATNWSGTPLCGTSSRIQLDTGALSAAKNVYFNIKQVIPSTFSAESNSNIVLTLRYTYS